MKYCPNCGTGVIEVQKFCEKCGASIPSGMSQGEESASLTDISSSSTMGFQPYDRPGSLFDIGRNYYILKEK